MCKRIVISLLFWKEKKKNIASIISTSKLLFVVILISKIGDNSWLINTCAIEHMAFDHKCFVTYKMWGKTICVSS